MDHARVRPVTCNIEVVVVDRDPGGARESGHGGRLLAKGLFEGSTVHDHHVNVRPLKLLLEGAVRTEDVERIKLVHVEIGPGTEDARQVLNGQANEHYLKPIAEGKTERLRTPGNRSAEGGGCQVGSRGRRLVVAAERERSRQRGRPRRLGAAAHSRRRQARGEHSNPRLAQRPARAARASFCARSRRPAYFTFGGRVESIAQPSRTRLSLTMRDPVQT